MTWRVIFVNKRRPRNNKDISGIRFGRLIAKEIVYKKPRYWWKCECDCGKEKYATLYQLETGNTKSCGCYKKDFKNSIIAGSKYYRWKPHFKTGNVDSSGSVYWMCECECGVYKEISAATLKSGQSKSCGCLHKELLKERLMKKRYERLLSRIGDKVNEFTILKIIEEHPGYKTIFLCECSCGKKVELKEEQLYENTRQSCGHMKYGKFHWNYNHKLTDEERIANNSRGSNPRYQSFRRSVLKRDGNKCVICGFRREKDMRVHHLYSWNTHAELRYEIGNAVTLCPRCHDIQYEGSFHNIYKNGNNTKQQFEEFRNNRKVSNN